MKWNFCGNLLAITNSPLGCLNYDCCVCCRGVIYPRAPIYIVCVISRRLRKLNSLTAGEIPFTHLTSGVWKFFVCKNLNAGKKKGTRPAAVGFLPATAQISQVWRPLRKWAVNGAPAADFLKKGDAHTFKFATSSEFGHKWIISAALFLC